MLEFFAPTYDYICDAKWSPINGPVFSTITSGGTVALWNLAKSVIEPTDTLILNKNVSGPQSSSKLNRAALNKFTWLRDGRKIVAGDAKGNLHLVSVQESAVINKAGDEAKFEHLLFSSQNASSLPSM